MNRRRALTALAASAAAYPFRAGGNQGGVLPWSDLEPLPAGTRARYTDLTRITGEVVPNDEFFILDHGEVPVLTAPAFRLTVGRRGAPPVRTLGLDELAGLPRRESVAAFECCGNGGVGMHGLVGAARWGGVPLAPLLEELVDPHTR
ncbi:MAG: molybdopterin-dependent oxidoreductase, partial [Acidobacteria bacterium]|nr:molybdopterin-dependent oxidoreductase [Acidobacteriota bacterium]